MRALPFVFALTLAACGGRAGPRDPGATADGAVRDGPHVHGDAGAHCDDLAERYLGAAYGLNYCSGDGDCKFIDPVCSITRYAGLGICYLYVNAQADFSELSDLEFKWVASICPIDWCGDCGPPPVLRCHDGSCVLAGGGY
ncbi:MAG: hypothetical protein HY906_08770 [Deltaproteobacteria bacterium]|nr:hypothetical protein [Deltaproteobacteria bacterium]